MDEEQKIGYQIAFLPWAGLENQISIGSVKFLPYKSIDKAKINKKIYLWLDEYFKHFVDQKKPVDSITIGFVDKLDFHRISGEEWENTKNAANALYFSAISTDCLFLDRHIQNAQIYEMVVQNFQPSQKLISFSDGSFVHIDKFLSIKPSSQNRNRIFDEDVISGFDALFKNGSEENRRRIHRSLWWFWLSHVWADYLLFISRVVMMATAFEILLDIKEDKTRTFAKKLNEAFKNGNLKSDCRKMGYTSKKKDEKYNEAGCWGIDFYNLRSKIVHGEVIESKDLICLPEDYISRDNHGFPINRPKITHLMPADFIYCSLILKELGIWPCGPGAAAPFPWSKEKFLAIKYDGWIKESIQKLNWLDEPGD